MLTLVTAFWGVSYILSDICLTELPPMNLNAFRFITAFVLLGIVFNKSLLRLNKITVYYSILIGISLAGTYIFFGYGLSRTSLSNAAFICALPVVVTPILARLLFKTELSRRQWLCIIICVFGLAMLTLNDELRPASGDVICMGVPFCYAADLLLTEKAVKTEGVDPLGLGVLQLAVVGIITLVMSLILETPRLPGSPKVWLSALFLGLFCTGFAFVIQAVQQQYTSASHVGLIFALEPLFASVAAYFIAAERLTPRGYLGMALMFTSLILMELKPLKKG